MLRRILTCTTKDLNIFFFSWINQKVWWLTQILLLIYHMISTHTHLIYWWYDQKYKYVLTNLKILIVLMRVLLYTLLLVPVRSWFVRMSHMPKKTSSREWVWWAPVCTVQPGTPASSTAISKLRQTYVQSIENLWAEWSGHRHAAMHGWGTFHGTDGADLLAWINSGDTRMRLAVPRNGAVVVQPSYAGCRARRRPLNWWWRRARKYRARRALRRSHGRQAVQAFRASRRSAPP